MSFFGLKKIGPIEIILVLIVVFLGWVFLTQRSSSTEDEEFMVEPTRWSQEEDYLIEEVNGRTKVTNTEAGFSFLVPEGWRLEKEIYLEDEFFINLLHPSAVIHPENKNLTKGCGMTVQLVFDKQEVFLTQNAIDFANEDANGQSVIIEEVVNVQGYTGLQRITKPSDQRILRQFGVLTEVKLPLSESELLEFGIRTIPDYAGSCTNDFQSFISSLKFID